jgi:methyltransferase of ATP-grasp peptide maturase system
MDSEQAAGPLRLALAGRLADEGLLTDPRWRRAVEAVPRHLFVPGFYAETSRRSHGLTIWEPVTEALDRDRWLRAAYSDATLITQFDGDEGDWDHPAVRSGGAPTSSSTLPSLVMRMWLDADLRDGHHVLEVGTGTGYSAALAAEWLGDDGRVTSVEVDSRRLDRAATALRRCGCGVHLAVADGLHGYWPRAPYDRIVAACSVRTIPLAWLAQARPGGKILTTLSGWLYGYARALLTVTSDYGAAGHLLPGTISFMAARAQERPAPGNPADWDALTKHAPSRPARHSPRRLEEATDNAFFSRFLAQLAAPGAQVLSGSDDVTHLVDVTSGSAASLTCHDQAWQVRQAGPKRLWDAIEDALDSWDSAGRPNPQEFDIHVSHGRQAIRHPAPGLSFTLPGLATSAQASAPAGD